MTASADTTLVIRPLGELDRAVIQEFVMSDPDYVRTCFDRDPSSADAENVLSSLPEGITAPLRGTWSPGPVNGQESRDQGHMAERRRRT
jgi:hypothetical protein